MKLSLHLIVTVMTGFFSSVCGAQTLSDTLEVSYKIDDLLEAEYEKKGYKPNEIVDDGTFVRRAYINITGRIPTIAEAKTFIDSKNPGKRVKLIDGLIESDGFKGKMFLFYSELLRLQTNKESYGGAMHQFLYEAAHKNRPYDKVVHDMLSARGHIAENPAVAYYLRDTGMTLDNVSNSVQVFLGTQIGCAQCHDHPFEDTTQMDFYKLAAFSGGFSFRHSPSAREELKRVGMEAAKKAGVDFNKMAQKEGERKGKGRLRSRNANKGNKNGKQMGQVANTIRKYAKPAIPVFKYYGRNEMTDNPAKELKLPHDYQYNDGKPDDAVKPGVLFGTMPELDGNSDRREAFADWVVSPTNPMFAKVIANRLWAHAFGYGLAEPLDNWTDRTKVSNPAVLEFLAEEMKSNGYDIKQTLRTLYFTTLFQRTVSPINVSPGKTFHFAGPLLRRMKGEELHDSMMTLEAGSRIDRVNHSRIEAWDKFVENYQTIKRMSGEDIIKLGQTITAAEKASNETRRKLQTLRVQLTKAKQDGDPKVVADLNKKQRALYAEMRESKKSAVSNMTSMNQMGSMMQMGGQEVDGSELIRYSMARSIRFKRGGQFRASENPQPFGAGTMVRQFGGTDGEVSNNSSDHASVPQALSMLNGKEIFTVTDKKGALPLALKNAKSANQRLEVLFLGIYSRYPTAKEKMSLKKYAQDLSKISSLAKAMINSKSFMFVQ